MLQIAHRSMIHIKVKTFDLSFIEPKESQKVNKKVKSTEGLGKKCWKRSGP
jgi:hypothetical protein